MRRLALFLLLIPQIFFAQETHPQNGVRESKPEYIALKNGTIVVSPEQTIDKGTLLIKDGKIVDVGRFVTIPKGTYVIDCSDKVILPSFIDLNATIGLPEPKAAAWSFRPQLESSKTGSYYWNESIHPEFNAANAYSSSPSDLKKYREMGFGMVLNHLNDGIAQGTGGFIALNDRVTESILKSDAAAFFSFDKGASRQTYPSSQMGSIALLRQALYDAQWYEKQDRPKVDLSLQALNQQKTLPLFFHIEENWENLRAKKIADEFGLSFYYLGAGDEYEIVDDLVSKKMKMVIPISFPAAYDVHDPYVSRQIPLSQLQKWEMAPYNARILSDKEIPFALTAQGNKNAAEFWANIEKMMEAGLKESEALAALTTTPAGWIGMDKEVGTLEKGKLACFTIYDGNPFVAKSTLLENWVQGNQYIINELPVIDPRGSFNLLVDTKTFPIVISGTVEKPRAEIKYWDGKDSVSLKTFLEVSGTNVVLQFAIHNDEWNGSVNLKGKFNEKLGIFEGSGQLPNGKWVAWNGIRNDRDKDKKKSEEYTVKKEVPELFRPMGAFGWSTVPTKKTILIQNATVWTNEEDGIQENMSVLVVNGKISKIGKGLSPSGAIVIDGKGMHLTPGIIDEHSHIAISKGVNEGGQAISAEVSIGDVVRPDDINIYRQLSGGVTAAQLLHGSANPIGGQSALIKLKWGYSPEEMLIPNAPGFIKCALGENVKQANWGDFQTVRFPQTRMGVEQVFYDGFNRAKEYEKQKKTGNYRRDLELDALVEILNAQRFITCHSYVQSEINMLMHVADSMGFTLNTFTHILEGYKVADKMAKHGAGGSTFADWWAYKYEVKDAIPYNASLMQEQGVVVAINSDDAEMGRRLNQEAAKTIKYGGMTEEEALKLVTLNPAKLLHLDDRMGSIKVGKDADLVLWSAHPLSAEARAEITIIDGIIFFDRRKQETIHDRDEQNRARIVTEMLDANQKGEKKISFFKKGRNLYHCDTEGEDAEETENLH